MKDFSLVVLSRQEYRRLRLLGKFKAYAVLEPDILNALALNGFIEYQPLGVGTLGGIIFGTAVKISGDGERYLLYRKQQSASRWGDRISGAVVGALLVALAWVLTLIPVMAP